MSRKYYETEEFKQLQKTWDDKLKEDGFDDIERNAFKPPPHGRDTNPHTTLPPDHVSIDAAVGASDGDEDLTSEEFFLGENLRMFGAPTSLASTDVAKHWSYLHARANELPRTYPRRRFLILWTGSGNRSEAARDGGITPKAARVAIAKFLKRVGVTDRRCRPEASESEPDPFKSKAPVRRLPRAEIKKLDYKAPKEIRRHTFTVEEIEKAETEE